MINHTGKNLSILITTKANQDWQTFATWYSFYKNLPEASVVIACVRSEETPYQYFQWAKRLRIKILYQKQLGENATLTRLNLVSMARSLLQDNILVVPVYTMAIDTLDPQLVEIINSRETIFCPDNDVWLFKGIDQVGINEMINRYVLDDIKIEEIKPPISLIKEVKETEFYPLVSYRKGCGKWIDTLRGCPLSNAEGLISGHMTVNENRVIELWKKMVNLYSVVV
jgi:hypothetical protein